MLKLDILRCKKVKLLKALESVEDIFSGSLNIRMDAVRSFGSLKLSQCCLQELFLG